MPIAAILNRPQLVTIQSIPLPALAPGIPTEETITHIIFDASINESYQSPARVTQHPVEQSADDPQGINVVDHVQILPRVITLEGIISDSPLPLQTLSLEAFTGAISSSALAETLGSATLSQLAYEKLEELKNAKAPLSLITGLTEFSPVVISNLNVRRNVNTGRALSFSLTVQEVIIVDSDLVLEDLGFQATQGSTIDVSGIPS